MELKDLAGIAIIFIVVAIVVGISASVLSEFSDKYGSHSTVTNINESITFSGGAVKLATYLPIASNSSGYIMSNSTNSTISTNNYDFLTNKSVILKAGASANLGASSTARFTYLVLSEGGDVMMNSSLYGKRGEEELSSWLPTIAIVVMAAVIIGIIALYFKFTS